MSIERVAAALLVQGLTPAEKLCFVGMANHDGDGGCWPAVSTLATYVGVSERQVQRLIRSLEEKGRVATERNAGGSRKTANDRRPNLYVLDYRGDTSVTPRDDTGVVDGVTQMSPEPSLNHPVKEPPCSSGDERPPATPPGDLLFEQNFSDFWSMYPRRIGKPAAKKALRAALRKDAAAVIATGHAAWVEFWKASATEPGFIPHPATWLNQERWNDTPPPLPERTVPAPSRADDVSINLALDDATEFFVGRELLQWRHEHIIQLRATIRTMHNWGFELGETMIRIGIAARRPPDMIEPSKLARLPRVERFPGMPPGDLSEAMETAYRNLAWRAS